MWCSVEIHEARIQHRSERNTKYSFLLPDQLPLATQSTA
jgi:hypothetical protein